MPVVRLVLLAFAKTFSKLFSVATVTFFGRAPSRDDDKLGLVGLLSLVWLAGAIAVAVPGVAETLIPFLPDDEALLRAVAIAIAVLVPPIVGAIISQVQNQPDSRRNVVRHLFLGYVYAAVIAVLTVALVIVVPVVKASELVRRYDWQHLAVMVPPDGHERFREHVTEVLTRHGHSVQEESQPAPVRWLFSGLARTESHIFQRGMDIRMRRLVGELDGEHCEVVLHATDLSIIGPRKTASKAFALLAEELDPRVVYFSWDEASQRIERAICRCWDELDAGRPCDPDELEGLADDLRAAALDPPEWNAVRRQLYRIVCETHRLRAEQAVAERQAQPSGGDGRISATPTLHRSARPPGRRQPQADNGATSSDSEDAAPSA